jgi:hypothetical protein
VLESNGEVSLFFNTCSLPGTASIEDLGASFGTFLTGLQYSNGQPVETVDVVTHSMGGLVLRSYLSGKQNAHPVFQPPAATHVRKVVFLASPNAGTGIASLLGVSNQVDEMASGSNFLFWLDTWNDATDDLRGVDAIAEAGNAGSGGTGNAAGFDDGVVTLTSASLQFYGSGRTRVVPYCHIPGGGIISDFGLCPSDAQGIANIDSAMHDSSQIIVSFLNGTDAWQSVGTAAENDPFLSVDGGLIVAAHAADDSSVTIDSVSASLPMTTLSRELGVSSDGNAYSDQFPAGSIALNVTAGALSVNSTVTLPVGGTEPYTVKPGPLVARVFPAAAANYPLELAPRMLIAIYGTGMASATVSINGTPLSLLRFRYADQCSASRHCFGLYAAHGSKQLWSKHHQHLCRSGGASDLHAGFLGFRPCVRIEVDRSKPGDRRKSSARGRYGGALCHRPWPNKSEQWIGLRCATTDCDGGRCRLPGCIRGRRAGVHRPGSD